MEAPKEVYPEGTPPVSPAVSCTINLTIQFFVVYLCLAVFRTIDQFNRHPGRSSKHADIFQLAACTVNFAPMLSILFVGARMRALQINPHDGNPQAWAQNCMYMCTYSVLVQTLLVVLVPYFFAGSSLKDLPKKGASEGDIQFEITNKPVS